MAPFRLALLLLALCLPPGARAGAQRQPEIAVRFLLTADPRDGATFVTTLTWQGRPVVVSRVPVFSEREIVSIFPFTAEDGTFGCALQLNDSGRVALQTITVAHRGGRAFILVGGRVITPLALDRIVSDGIVTIPFGLTEADIRGLGKSFRIMPEARGAGAR